MDHAAARQDEEQDSAEELAAPEDIVVIEYRELRAIAMGETSFFRLEPVGG